MYSYDKTRQCLHSSRDYVPYKNLNRWLKSYTFISLLILSPVIFYLIHFYRTFNYKDFYYKRYHRDIAISDQQRIQIYEKLIDSLRKPAEKCEGFCKRPETKHVDCGRILRGDRNYTLSLTGHNRVFLAEDPYIDMSCPAVLRRIRPNTTEMRPLEKSVAFARIVYRDYEFIEQQVQASYHPDNFFCFVVDNQAPKSFQSKIRALTDCLHNAIMLPVTQHYDSNGHNANFGHLRCMQASLQYKWDYFYFLQNHDVIMKSVYEMSRILEIFGGANDVFVDSNVNWWLLNSTHHRSPKSMKLFRDESEVSGKVLNKNMTVAHGWVQATVSREAIDFLVNKLDLTVFLGQWNTTDYAGDEQFIPTFMVNSQLKMPGHFTDECLKKGIALDNVSRMHNWDLLDNWNRCATKTSRHYGCIMGVEDFRNIAKMPNLMFNKAIPEFDYTIVECTAELLYNRTFLGQVDHKLDENYYSNMVQVLYHKHHHEPDYKLNCTPSYTPWKYSVEF